MRFGEVVVSTGRDEDGEPHGSEICFDGRVWKLSAWPYRVATVEPLGDGAVVVSYKDGAQRLLEAEDAL